MAIFTHAEMWQLRKEAATKAIHKIEGIEVWRFEPKFLDAIVAKMERNTKLELTRNDGQLYVALGGETIEATLTVASLLTPAAES